MRHDPQALLLSAQRALLGAIAADVRRISVRRDGATITLTTISAVELDEDAIEALSIAATEIMADFPDCTVQEQFVVRTAYPFPPVGTGEAILYQRLEAL